MAADDPKPTRGKKAVGALTGVIELFPLLDTNHREEVFMNLEALKEIFDNNVKLLVDSAGTTVRTKARLLVLQNMPSGMDIKNYQRIKNTILITVSDP